MINTYYGNLFETVLPRVQENDNIMHIVVHGCNAQGVMGSGFAKELRSRYPDAYTEYRNTFLNKGLALGDVVCYIPTDNLVIANAITQVNYGYDGKKYVSYDAIDTAFTEIEDMASTLVQYQHSVEVHFPLLGAGLAGGNWDVISQIIDTRLKTPTKNLYILK